MNGSDKETPSVLDSDVEVGPSRLAQGDPGTVPVHVVLVEPEIPQNAGNVARTCAVVGAHLHLVHPLGFSLSDRYVKRAGLDYWPHLTLTEHKSLESYLASTDPDLCVFTTKHAVRPYTDAAYPAGVHVVFGKESTGLPPWIRDQHPDRCVRIPMLPERRSLNLSNTVAIVVYEALRRRGFPGMV